MMIATVGDLRVISLVQNHSRSLIATTFALWLCYVLALAFYRLYLSPLAKFPGPKLAALTEWYEVYFDIFKDGGGQFTFEIKRMHEKYGPIVRINPVELHINDPAYYDVIHGINKSYDKLESLSHRFHAPLSAFTTANSEKHRQRRGAIFPFFTRSRVRENCRYIRMAIDRVSYRLSTEYVGTDKIINVLDLWGATTSDIVMEICFARSKHFVDAPNFQSEFCRALKDIFFSSYIMTHFGFIMMAMDVLPNWLVKKAAPRMKPTIEFQEELTRQVSDILEGRNVEAEDSAHLTIFHEILSSKLAPEELTLQRLQNEAVAVVGGGIETTQWAISVASYHILANPDIERRLRAELRDAIPDPDRIPDWMELEKLTYLHAIITEALRISIGPMSRSPRINRSSAWTYRSFAIPPGTPVSMSTYLMHTNAVLFPEPDAFLPDRWLGDPKVDPARLEKAGYLPPLDGRPKPLAHYMVGFGRGPRMCVAMNLAYAELYLGLATLFRRHELELFETGRRDVDVAMEMGTPQPWRGSKGIRVLVRK
ncbi:cytochrome P450 [Annulohypoxylon bovei var. microspora]|nr:cytochrome P450 [Annulohypoxylon bovei var. microspora]